MRFARKAFQRIVNVRRHFHQQVAHLFIEGVGYVGIQVENQLDNIITMQRKCGGCTPAELCATLMPRLAGGVMLEILTPERPVFAKRRASRAASGWIIGVHRNLQPVQIFRATAKGCNRPDLVTFFVKHADPRHLHAAEVHYDAAGLREQFRLAGAAHDGLITLAQSGVKLVDTLVSRFGILALRVDPGEIDFRFR